MKVSVIIPCYNAGRWIAAAIESCIRQTCKDFEIILVDDGSTDSSYQIIEAYGKQYPDIIRITRQENRGVAHARNKGMELSQSDFLLFLDADDYLSESCLQVLIQAFREGVDAVYGDVSMIDQATGRETFRNQAPISKDGVISLMHRAPITSGVMFRREAIINLPWDASLECAEEFAYFVEAVIQGVNFFHIPSLIAHIRIYDSPDRRTTATNPRLCIVLANLFLRFERLLEEKNSYLPDRKIFMSLAFLNYALLLKRYHPEEKESADILYKKANQSLARKSPLFRPFSFQGVAAFTNLEFSCSVWRFKDWVFSWMQRLIRKVLPVCKTRKG